MGDPKCGTRNDIHACPIYCPRFVAPPPSGDSPPSLTLTLILTLTLTFILIHPHSHSLSLSLSLSPSLSLTLGLSLSLSLTLALSLSLSLSHSLLPLISLALTTHTFTELNRTHTHHGPQCVQIVSAKPQQFLFKTTSLTTCIKQTASNKAKGLLAMLNDHGS